MVHGLCTLKMIFTKIDIHYFWSLLEVTLHGEVDFEETFCQPFGKSTA